mgnify:FL=1
MNVLRPKMEECEEDGLCCRHLEEGKQDCVSTISTDLSCALTQAASTGCCENGELWTVDLL